MGEDRAAPTGGAASTATAAGHLDPGMVELVGRAEIGVVATADAHGECDSSLRTGPPGFVRVLDAGRVAYPEYRGNGVMASLGNIEENPHAGLMLLDFAGDRDTLHLRGRARLVADAELRAEVPDLPVETVPGRRTDVWVVIDLEQAVLGDGDEPTALAPVARATDWGTDDTARKGGDFFGAAAAVARGDRTPERTGVPAGTGGGNDRDGGGEAAEPAAAAATAAAPERPAPTTVAPTTSPADGRGRPSARPAAPAPPGPPTPSGPLGRLGDLGRDPRLPLLTGVLALLVVLLAVGLLVSLLSGPSTPDAAPTPPGPTGPPTLYGRVVEVTDPDTVVVDVAGQRVTVGALGIDATTIPPCAARDALDFARRTLDRQVVTLVPDPTVVETSPRRVYIVLSRQLSYTDAIIQAGWAAPAGTALYRPGFDEERARAQADGVGMYGPPCVPSS